MIEAEQLHARILEELDLTREVEDEELTRIIHQVLGEAGEREYRERLGRMLVEIAKRAESVERVFCGIGQRIK